MAALNDRPIIMPLSNPTSKSECTFEAAVAATHRRVLFASGSPYPPLQHAGRTLHPAQANNAYIFPAVGHAAVLARCREIRQASGARLAVSVWPRGRGFFSSTQFTHPLFPLVARVPPHFSFHQFVLPSTCSSPRSDDVFLVAAERLASMSSLAELEAGFLFPRFSGIKQVSARLMAACADYMVSE
jgi:malate dehydrogenase (oxaloacetate-decarboxylating)(NADP+)